MSNFDDTELERLIDHYMSGEISDGDFDALQVILEKSETARQKYLARVEMDAMLYQHFAGSGSFPNLDVSANVLDSISVVNK